MGSGIVGETFWVRAFTSETAVGVPLSIARAGRRRVTRALVAPSFFTRSSADC